jgi:hypothetical protein
VERRLIERMPVVVQPVFPEFFTVIRGHDHQGPAELSPPLQLGEQFAQFRIEVGDGPVVGGNEIPGIPVGPRVLWIFILPEARIRPDLAGREQRIKRRRRLIRPVCVIIIEKRKPGPPLAILDPVQERTTDLRRVFPTKQLVVPDDPANQLVSPHRPAEGRTAEDQARGERVVIKMSEPAR